MLERFKHVKPLTPRMIPLRIAVPSDHDSKGRMSIPVSMHTIVQYNVSCLDLLPLPTFSLEDYLEESRRKKGLICDMNLYNKD